MEFYYHNPTELTFGEGTFARVGELSAPLGCRAMVVTGRSAMEKAGCLQRATDLLEGAGVAVTVFNEIPPNPTLDAVLEGAELARAERCEVMVGLGGGSAMDAAKAIAVAASHECDMREFLLPDENGQKRLPSEATLPVVAVTSTAGTSSELTPFAVINVPDTHAKPAMAGPNIFPRIAIEDPELTYTMPAQVTAATGVDVFCHAAEGYISTVATPLTDHTALKAMELVAEYLPKAVADGENISARRGMMLANTFAGYTLAQAGGNVMHALEHPMGGHYPDIAHGAGLAAVVVAWAEQMWDRAPQRFATVARIFGIQDPDDNSAAAKLSGVLKEFLGTVAMDLTLSDLGIAEDMLGTLADDALRYMIGGVRKTPGETTREDLMGLLQASYGG
jgi:alcohol dehydrogenase